MARAKEARLSGPQGECLNRANQPMLPPSSSRNPIFTTTRNWVTRLFSTTASNSLAQTDWTLRIVLDARSTASRTGLTHEGLGSYASGNSGEVAAPEPPINLAKNETS